MLIKFKVKAYDFNNNLLFDTEIENRTPISNNPSDVGYESILEYFQYNIDENVYRLHFKQIN